MKLTTSFLIISGIFCFARAGYVPPGPRYRCPKEKQLLHPCVCTNELDSGVEIACNNTNLASMSIALNNLATFDLPIEKLTIDRCHIGKLFGSLLYKLKLKILEIRDTPIEIIDDHSFLGINNTLKEFYLFNSSLKEFPKNALKDLGQATIIKMESHNLNSLPKDAFVGSSLSSSLVRLHISKGNLSTPSPETFQPLRKLKTLDLHGNRIGGLQRNQFKGLRDVEVLDLSFNEIPKIDASHLADLTKMSWLNVSHNRLTEMTRGAFARNTLLKVLNMSHNKIKKLDSNSFKGMRFLRRLYLSDNLIADVGRGTFGSLIRIGTIDLARNFIKKIDYQMFYELNYVEIIDVSSNNVTEIQKQAFKNVYFANVDLSKNNISKIENGAFENCANITLLDLSYNNITSIPKKAFDETTYALELRFSFNKLTALNQVPLHNMTGLKILNVSHNEITTVPKGTFPKLYELHTIDLSHNNLTDIFNSVFQTLFSLRILNLSYNQMDQLKPSTFGPLPTLLELDMSHNKLNRIAKSAFTRLSGMRQMILNNNEINSMFTLPISVSHLDLSHNKFEELPEKLWPSMNSLLHLDLSYNNLGNRLTGQSLVSLLTLQSVNLNYNNITEPPWEAFQPLSSLQFIYLKGNMISKLNKAAFGHLPVVFEIDLSENILRNISSKAFQGLLQLNVLKLNKNNLTHIQNDAFHGLVALRSLDLSHNMIEKVDNKTNSLFEDLLSMEKLNLSNNKISFLTRSSFPSSPYVPYRLKDIDLSYNIIPLLSFDLTVGTKKVEKLNLSHNSISDVRRGVIGNLTSLKILDLSHNKLSDLTSDKGFFKLPETIAEIYLSENILGNLPWKYLTNASNLNVLDLRRNIFGFVNRELTELILKGKEIYLEGNPLNCDCFLRPLKRYFDINLVLEGRYRSLRCAQPPYLANRTIFDLPEDRLNCPFNVNTSSILETYPGEYDITPDLRFRSVKLTKKHLEIKWRVVKTSADIADTYVAIRSTSNTTVPPLYEEMVPYFRRNSIINLTGDLKHFSKFGTDDYQLCLLATTSKGSIRGFYKEQCKNFHELIKASKSRAGDVKKPQDVIYFIILNVILLKWLF